MPPEFFDNLDKAVGTKIETFLFIFTKVDSELSNDFLHMEKFNLALEIYREAQKK